MSTGKVDTRRTTPTFAPEDFGDSPLAKLLKQRQNAVSPAERERLAQEDAASRSRPHFDSSAFDATQAPGLFEGGSGDKRELSSGGSRPSSEYVMQYFGVRP